MRVIATTIPGLGHLQPMVPLLLALRDAGHDVTVASPPSFLDFVTASGLDGHGLGPDWTEPNADAALPGFLDSDSSEQHRILLRYARRLAPDLQVFASSVDADVIVHDHAETAGWVVAERLGIPNVPFAMTARVLHPTTMRIMGVATDYERVLAACGLPPGAGRAARWLYVDALPPSFTRGLVPDLDTVRHVRYEPDDRGGGGALPDWVTRRPTARPLVYVTLGTIFNHRTEVLGALARGAARLDVDVLVTAGHHGAGRLGGLPANVHVEEYVPQSLLYPYVSAVVCHGGFGTVCGSLSHGVPLVCAPMSADQPLNAGLAARSGAAANLATTAPEGRIFPLLGPGEPREEHVAEALSEVLTTRRHRERARALAGEIAAQPSPATVAGLVEQLVSIGRPVTTAREQHTR